jgi:hypothetical protein
MRKQGHMGIEMRFARGKIAQDHFDKAKNGTTNVSS